MTSSLILSLTLVFSIALSFRLSPLIFRACGRLLGLYVRSKSRSRRQLLFSRAQEQRDIQTPDTRPSIGSDHDGWEEIETQFTGHAPNGGRAGEEWRGIVGFFHPFCNAGGGGERVLWAAIRATQRRWPEALCVVYTGDHDASKEAIIKRVEDRFNIHLHPPTISFLYLSTRHYVLSSTWPYFTLLGQSLGSLVLAYDALSLMVPDIFIDTMGYAFALAFSKFLFPDVPTCAYVHYPTISTDMLGSLAEGGQGIHAGTGTGMRGAVKRRYWTLFARLYGWVGGEIDVVMTNSSWTQRHIVQLWGPARTRRKRGSQVTVVFPPVAVEELEREVDVSPQSERHRGPYLLYIAQFRPEKNHQLILSSFADLLSSNSWNEKTKPTLVLLGSVRDSEDATRVYKLRLLAHELKIKESVQFICDATWPQILEWLRKSSVGVNGMWNEHFGIGIVEYQAAGLVSVVHDSGGPKFDIVVDIDGKPTGFHASTSSDFAVAFRKALELGSDETLAMRLRARRSAQRFGEGVFAVNWLQQMERLIQLQSESSSRN